MTAPAAPIIRVTSDGSHLLIRWQPVPTATDYNVYVCEDGGAYGLQSQYDLNDDDADGSFAVWESGLLGTVKVKVTALNVGAEESGYSNVCTRVMSGPGDSNAQTSALNHASRFTNS